MSSNNFRKEKDSLGELNVPADVICAWAAPAARASAATAVRVLNFIVCLLR